MNTHDLRLEQSVESFRWRTLNKSKQALWEELFQQYFHCDQCSCVLDIGCGTGRFAKLITEQFACQIVGVDISLEMLAAAQKNLGYRAAWCLGTAERLPFADNVFDVCISSFMLHHLADKARALNEIYRTLRPAGQLGIRYLSHEQLRQDPLHRFFPSALDIELARTPDLAELRNLLHEAGFASIIEIIVRQPRADSAKEYVEKLQNRYVSALWLIAEEEFQGGMENASKYFATHSLSATESQQEITFLVCEK